MALVGILTSIDSISSSLSSNFSSMGASTFSLQNRGMNIHVGKGGKKRKVYPSISFDEAMDFKEKYAFPATVSVSVRASALATLKYREEKTNPNIFVFGIDENYLQTSGYELAKGRKFSAHEIYSGSALVILGDEIAKTLFPKTDPLDKLISIGANKFRVIGVTKPKGSTMGFSGDRNAFITITTARKNFPQAQPTYMVQVMVDQPEIMENAIGEATGLFRTIRGDKPGKEESFEIAKSDKVAEMLMENLSMVTLSATIIGFITLLGAAIGLMNIMLVSVTERTREIGVRKAIGASASIIRNQFLIEAIVICQLGGLLGILLGIVIGNLVGNLIGSEFIVPWDWMFLGVGLCLLVGLLSGIYPASKAAKLDPIESLRYE